MPAFPSDQLHPRILAVSNQKGGVGKTTTAVNLSAALADLGVSVLLIDMDPQGNASTSLGITRSDRADGAYALLRGSTDLGTVQRPSGVRGLVVIPAGTELVGAEIELVDLDRREYQLRDALSTIDRRANAPDLIVIDCPPGLGLLTINALVAADSVLVPMQCEFLAMEGLSHVAKTLDLVRQRLNPLLQLNGIVLTMVDQRNNLSELVEADVRGFFGNYVYETIVPRNVRISEAPSHGMPIRVYDPRSAGALAYGRLALEYLRRNQCSPKTGRNPGADHGR